MRGAGGCGGAGGRERKAAAVLLCIWRLGMPGAWACVHATCLVDVGSVLLDAILVGVSRSQLLPVVPTRRWYPGVGCNGSRAG